MIMEYDSDDQITVIERVSDSEADAILDFSLRTVVGFELADIRCGNKRELCRTLSLGFAETLVDIVETLTDSPEPGVSTVSPTTNLPTRDDTSHAATDKTDTSLGKRKKDHHEGRADKEDLPGFEVATESPTAKRLRHEESIRCPYRARNPIRFNVRDERTCSFACFTQMADLR
jgi:hypothetical protein